MPAKLIDGKSIAEEIKKEVAKKIYEKQLNPGLAVILVGDDPASHLYVKLKQKACAQVGIEFYKYYCPGQATKKEITDAIEFLNNDAKVNGILVQLPLPKDLNEDEIIQLIDPKKDVDGFHPKNLERLFNNNPLILPGLAMGIIKLIESTNEKLENKKAVIISNSTIFSKPLVKLLEKKGIIVESLLSNQNNLKEKTSSADILIVAVGKPKFITADMVKSDSIIIDVGTNKIGKKTVGDVDFEAVADKAAWITPVPGGVGPMTIAMLLKNTLDLTKK